MNKKVGESGEMKSKWANELLFKRNIMPFCIALVISILLSLPTIWAATSNAISGMLNLPVPTKYYFLKWNSGIAKHDKDFHDDCKSRAREQPGTNRFY